MKARWRELGSFVRRATRWTDWAASKVPLLLTVFYYEALRADTSPAALLQSFAAILAFICLGYAFGYALNDVADRDVDRLAGKLSPLGRLRPAWAGVLLVGLAAAGIGSLWSFYDRPTVLVLVVVSYAFGIGYSLRPMRFKERGWWGLVVGAAAQRSLPALVIFATFDDLGWKAALFGALLLVIGVRWMLAHQVLDLADDRKAGVRTYVTLNGRERGALVLRRIVFPVEVACLGAVLAVMVSDIPTFGLLLIPYAGWLWVRARLWGGVAAAFSFDAYQRQPLADFYHLYWPLSLSLLLVVQQPWLFPLAAVLLLWQGRYLVRGVGLVHGVLQARWQGTVDPARSR